MFEKTLMPTVPEAANARMVQLRAELAGSSGLDNRPQDAGGLQYDLHTYDISLNMFIDRYNPIPLILNTP